ncbi:MAG: pyridoxamine 5'-phosphate oxidase family protein [Lacipirellulaceae bacterium]
MAAYASDVAFTPTVKAIQEAKGSRQGYRAMEERGGWQTTVTPDLSRFLSELDMFYLGTANAEGQPYIQYRGGPPGFLRVIDERTLGFADFAGNRQYISVGNLSENPRAFLFLMDYQNQRRVKVWGSARVVEGDSRLNARLSDPGYKGTVERAIVIDVQAWDVNCPQHIGRRIPEPIVAATVQGLRDEIADLKQRLQRAELGLRGGHSEA